MKIEKKETEDDKKKNPQKKEKETEEDETDVFFILPETVTLPAKHGIMFQFRAFSQKKGKINESFNLNSLIGNDRKVNQLLTTYIDGDFIIPVLTFSEKKLFFKYSWEKNVPFSLI